MKLFYTIILIGLTSIIYAQDVSKDTIDSDSKSLFIQDHKEQFNVKFDVSNDVISYKMPQERVELKIRPNLKLKYAFVLSYKFATIRLGIRPRASDESKKNKGESSSFRIHFKLLFDYWSHYFEFNHDKGYYIVNTEDFTPSIPESDFHIQFPNLTTNIFTGSSTYKLNENYSVRAIESQTEIQIKSAGSFMPGIVYSFYNIKDADKIIYPKDSVTIRKYYSDVKGMNFNLNAGYYYTFVYKTHWFANAYLTPGIGIDFYKTTNYSPTETVSKSMNDILFNLSSGVGAGYNGEKIFFGANYANRISNEKFDENKIQLNISKNSFHIYLGYRFKAPKPVRKSVEYVEEKIPILDNNSKDRNKNKN